MPHFADGVYQFGGVPVDVGVPYGMNSKFFFVDTEGGSNGNDGLTPDHARASITAALALCVANRRDTIRVLRWGTDNSETWPIPMSVAGVSVIGMRAGGTSHSSWAYIVGTESSALFHVTAANCRIMNFLLQGYDTGENMITTTNAANRCGIIGNFFATCNDGVGGTTAGTSLGYHSEVSGNFFSAQVSDHGIVQYNPAHLVIKGNIFSKVAGTYALELYAAGRPTIIGNQFALHSDVAGSAIRLRGATTHGWIDDNHANEGKTAMSQNPFGDNSPGATPNVWGLNYYGITATMPAAL